MKDTPENEVLACAVPQAAKQHNKPEVEVLAGFAFAVAAEGNVNVFAKPGGKGDVLASPEFGDAAGEVRGC